MVYGNLGQQCSLFGENVSRQKAFPLAFFFFFLISPFRNIKQENAYFPQAEARIGSQVAFLLSSALLIHQRGSTGG